MTVRRSGCVGVVPVEQAHVVGRDAHRQHRCRPSTSASRSSSERTSIRSNWSSLRMRCRDCQRQSFQSLSLTSRKKARRNARVRVFTRLRAGPPGRTATGLAAWARTGAGSRSRCGARRPARSGGRRKERQVVRRGGIVGRTTRRLFQIHRGSRLLELRAIHKPASSQEPSGHPHRGGLLAERRPAAYTATGQAVWRSSTSSNEDQARN